MTVELKLIGFGDERPPAFQDKDRLQLELATPATPRAVLQTAGIDDGEDLVLMDRDDVIPNQCWDDSIIDDGQKLTLLSAFEGG